MRQHPLIDVIWDGTRVYRAPDPGGVQALMLLADGHTATSAAPILGVQTKEAVKRRVNEVQSRLHALSPGEALYQLYRLDIVRNPWLWGSALQPVLDDGQRNILDVMARLGMTYEQAHKVLDMGQGTLYKRSREIHKLLGATNWVQAMARAVEHGDVKVDEPPVIWRGQI